MTTNPFNVFSNTKHIDKDVLMHQHRKNLEALTDASKTAAEVTRSIAQLHGQFLKQMFDDMQSMMQNFNPQSFKENPLKEPEKAIKEQVKKGLDHSIRVAEMMHQSQKDICEIFKSRFDEGVQEMECSPAKKMKH